MNLWKETKDILEYHGKTWSDATNVYCTDFSITKETFESLAAKTNYDNGYGLPYVAQDLMIKGNDFILIREEYDGSEGWRYIPLLPPTSFRQIRILDDDGGLLADMNNISMNNCIEYKEEI